MLVAELCCFRLSLFIFNFGQPKKGEDYLKSSIIIKVKTK